MESPPTGTMYTVVDLDVDEGPGLKAVEGLKILHDEINSVLEEYEQKIRDRCPWKEGGWLRDALHFSSPNSTLCWTSAITLIVCGLVLIVAAIFHEDSSYNCSFLQGIFIILLVAANVAMVSWDSWLRHMEIPQQIRSLLDQVQNCIDSDDWKENHFPQLCCPYSPCITLQWTIRDGKIINLPWALLVKGDLVEMRPGQQAPGLCTPADGDPDSPDLQAREVYSPKVKNSPAEEEDELTTPKIRRPLQSKRYILQETPYLTNLKLALDSALTRPDSYHNKLKHLLMSTISEKFFIPIFLVLVFFMGLLRYFYLEPWIGSGHWTEMFLIQPVAVCLPLLPLIFPLSWTILNCMGVAQIQSLFQKSRGTEGAFNAEWKTEVSTHSPCGVAADPFDESEDELRPYITWRERWPLFVACLRGQSGMPCRSANLLHVLGSVTALCCVDKKGILSWPNPTAEKVFFLRSSSKASCSSSNESLKKEESEKTTAEEEQDGNSENSKESSKGKETEKVSKVIEQDAKVNAKEIQTETLDPEELESARHTPQTVAEVLDLTHDHSSPFRLHFDDPSWRKHLNSLKPLGLSILLNTCNMSTQEHYTQFCSHVTCEAMHSEHLVPVTNRRHPKYTGEMTVLPGTNKCLCELAKQIGFQEQAQEAFSLEQQLSTFRHVPETVRRDIKFARSLSLAKLKFPFPHMVAVVVKENHGGNLQLLSQGTADIILDSCEEFWDGRDLCTLSQSDRRKVQDFYQRTSLTAYCTAFAYRPLTRAPDTHLSHMYLELPSDSKSLYATHAHHTETSLDCASSVKSVESIPKQLSRADDCFQLQCNQVFVGMVTMQYQAQTDMVQLIEQLERACIRFVHFSKENELRSRVFSEKMGLESGWNCHISLLSERAGSESGNSGSWHNSPSAVNLQSTSGPTPRDSSHTSLPRYAPTPPRKRHESTIEETETESLIRERPLGEETKTMSLSAPSAINLDFYQVKFDAEDLNKPSDGNALRRDTIMSDKKGSKDSMFVQSVDLTSQPDPCRSLSVLTDSTEQSAPVNFDMSNRAKLPRGIENIRPHLRHIDNVPLLVSLFTDCTPMATREMLSIMQEHGEVVCAMGSSANADNMPIFMQADASMAVEPLYPQVCQRISVFSPYTTLKDGISPIELSRILNSVSCSVSFIREEPISIFHLIMECRHYMQCLTNCLQFWLSSSVAVSIIQVVAIVSLLPPLFTIGQILWLQCVVIPILALSLIGKPTDTQIMQRATGKNQFLINTDTIFFVAWFYGSKFIPAGIVLLSLYTAALSKLCPLLNGVEICSLVYPEVSLNRTESVLWQGWGTNLSSLTALQHATCLLWVIHLIVISISFVHRDSPIWRENPLRNRLWGLSVLLLTLLQFAFSAIAMGPRLATEDEDLPPGLQQVPWPIYLLAAISPFVVFLINELVKLQEIKASVRQQKKARLEFGTKLGMNSPF
ncbi:transmembrane protein 94 isoform X2 [Neocloeon triangulifer]|uniref:transmembrane protein 94 isoform X2 n=1 Tax=Neocloeon triangulifer TaxID=2078957 RepID=UPI00286F1B5A|nr:transmembrane protein 94 isoform X2 [Neocloeon triangulifer]